MKADIAVVVATSAPNSLKLRSALPPEEAIGVVLLKRTTSDPKQPFTMSIEIHSE